MNDMPMPDLSSVAREAARAEAIRRDHVLTTLKGHEIVDDMGDGFIAGFTECASRLPSETEVAQTLSTLGFTCEYHEPETWGDCDMCVEVLTKAGDAVLALIGKRLSS